MEKRLEQLYYGLPAPSAYAGGTRLLQATRKKFHTNKVIEWLEGQDAHTLHKMVRYRFPRRPYKVFSPYELWEADLADFRALKTYNNQYSYLLVVIDVLSKYAWVEPLLNKTSKSVADGIERILVRNNDRDPLHFQTDKGKEFLGREVQQLLKKRNIIYRTVRDPDIKAAVAERFIRTLKERMWRYFTHLHTRRYIDVLDNIVQSYNNSWHSAIKMAPSAVNFYNANKVRENLVHRYAIKHPHTHKYNVQDLVRVSRVRTAFRKAYEGGWTLELFRIVRIDTSRQPPVYILEDLAGDKIDGYFYEQELSRVHKDLTSDVFEIDKVLRSKGSGRKKEYFVSWKGYPKKFNSWVSGKNLVNLQQDQ